MARHRNIRTMNIDDEYYEEDTVYGHSVPDDDYCISPATAAQFTFNRERKTDLSSYMGQEEIPEEEGEESDSDHHDSLSDSRDFKRPKLSDQDELRLNSCLEEVRGILGDTFPDNTLITTIIDQGYDTQKALNVLLSQQDAPKPQREPRQNRRARSQGDDHSDCSDDSESESNEIIPPLCNQEYTDLLPSPSNFSKNSSVSKGSKLNQKAKVFQFESPLSMLKKAVDSRSPPKNIDIPNLVSSDQIVKDKLAFLSLNATEKLYKSDSKGIQQEEKQSCLTELAKKHEGKRATLSSNSLSSGVGKLSLADLANKHSCQQSKPVMGKTHDGEIKLSDIRPDADSEEVPKKLSKVSLADLSSQHHKKEAGLANHGSSCSSKPVSLAELARLHVKKPSNPMPELPNQLFRVKSGVAKVKEDLANPHEGNILMSDPRPMAMTVTSVNGGNSLHSKQKLLSGNSPSSTKGIDLTKALLTSKPIKETNSVSMTADGTENTVAMEDGWKEETTGAVDLEQAQTQITFDMHEIKVTSEVKAPPSQFGGVVAQMSHKFEPDTCPQLRFPSFSYCRQAKILSKLPSPPAHIGACVRFDFSTPSPDDLVKAKQEQAFTALSSKPLT
ncbi:uncharacterized protein LOC135469842 isoform X2 [Liolophura sinensis]|uniref:uncharacterized protein LOC135469842 isoform X2 n=1 Tax=Liolophura sinensis TaxID=3198878 RepID=UPI003158A857